MSVEFGVKVESEVRVERAAGVDATLRRHRPDATAKAPRLNVVDAVLEAPDAAPNLLYVVLDRLLPAAGALACLVRCACGLSGQCWLTTSPFPHANSMLSS